MSITSVDQTLGNQVKTANKKGQVAMHEDGNRRSRNEWGSPAKTVKKKKRNFFHGYNLGKHPYSESKGKELKIFMEVENKFQGLRSPEDRNFKTG